VQRPRAWSSAIAQRVVTAATADPAFEITIWRGGSPIGVAPGLAGQQFETTTGDGPFSIVYSPEPGVTNALATLFDSLVVVSVDGDEAAAVALLAGLTEVDQATWDAATTT
jgi:hypothetical protein